MFLQIQDKSSLYQNSATVLYVIALKSDCKSLVIRGRELRSESLHENSLNSHTLVKRGES